jgi:hypothetical protein
MREVSFSLSGGVGGSTERRGTVAELLESIPYLLSARLVPPLRVVDDVLAEVSRTRE